MTPQKDSFAYRRLRQVIRSVEVVTSKTACTIEMEPNTNRIEANRPPTSQTTPALITLVKQVIEEAGIPCISCNPVISPVRLPRIVATIDADHHYAAAKEFVDDFNKRKLSDDLRLKNQR